MAQTRSSGSSRTRTCSGVFLALRTPCTSVSARASASTLGARHPHQGAPARRPDPAAAAQYPAQQVGVVGQPGRRQELRQCRGG